MSLVGSQLNTSVSVGIGCQRQTSFSAHLYVPSASLLAGKALVLRTQRRARSSIRRSSGQIVAWKFLADLGFKKPAWLPDFGKDKRKAILDRFYSKIDRSTYEELLADDVKIVEEVPDSKVYGKADWIRLMCDVTAPAIPDFNWTHATDGTKDDDGYCIVSVQATGHHTGAPFALPGPGREPIPASGQRFKLPEEVVKVKVEGGQIKDIVVLPTRGAGPAGLYEALSGKVTPELSVGEVLE